MALRVVGREPCGRRPFTGSAVALPAWPKLQARARPTLAVSPGHASRPCRPVDRL